MIDAPVSGGEIGAVAATLSIMVGGEADAFESGRPILEAMGNPERIVHVGGPGAGQICKVCNQMVIGGTLAAVSEAFALARRAGVDPAKVRDALLGGFAASRVLEVHGDRILKGDYTPGFRAELYAKDYRIAAETVAAHAAPAPVAAVVHALVTALIAAGRGADDYSALATVLFDLAALSHPLSSS
jgi:2-hydroxy-3-oxopropionate reductase